MTSEPVIMVKGVTKEFRLRSAARSLKSSVLAVLAPGKAARPGPFRALENVSFEVRRGETLGIIGANGAGKSTLLSLLTGTMRPTSGSIVTVGSMSSLLELGAGFHPDLTGRENVYLYGAIMGLTRSRMQKRFDSIVSFAGLEAFIDQPVKHYSSGMYVRLGFAVAVEVDPDILLVDEVLAVGDADFQRKCVARMEEFRESGKTMLVISHDLPTIQSISTRILLLDHGRIIGIGDPEHMVEEYESLTRLRNTQSLRREWGTGEARISGVRFLGPSGEPAGTFRWGEPLTAEVSYRSASPIDDPVFGFAVSDSRGRLIYGNNTQIEGLKIARIEGEGSIRLVIDRVLMSRGTYLFSFSIHSADHRINYHRADNCFPVEIESAKPFEGVCFMPCRWEAPR
jgi:ABC-type polysaccharide/polyol phosphate transport system ATPase subunit